MFQTDKPAVTSVAKRSPLSLLKSLRTGQEEDDAQDFCWDHRENRLDGAAQKDGEQQHVHPKMMLEPPVRAPKRTCPAIPPAPWHMGTPPTPAPNRFINPVEIDTPRSVTGLPGNSRLFSSVMAMTALPNVNGT